MYNYIVGLSLDVNKTSFSPPLRKYMYDNGVALDRPRLPWTNPQASESSLWLSPWPPPEPSLRPALELLPESSLCPAPEPRLERFPGWELGPEVTDSLHLESRNDLPMGMGRRDGI